MTRPLPRLLLAALLALAACRDAPTRPEPPPPPAQPRVLRLVLATPHADDGALLFTLAGGAVDSVTAPGAKLHLAPASATPRRVLLRGALAAGEVARVWLPPGADAARYQVTLEQVAARGSYAQRALPGYTLTLAP